LNEIDPGVIPNESESSLGVWHPIPAEFQTADSSLRSE